MDEEKEHVTNEENKADIQSFQSMVSWGPTDIVFCGNPGVGKSTLLSSISGNHFESGISFGAGLTAKLQFQNDPHNKDTRWADTPGLADIELAELAAKAINDALEDASKNKRKVKIFFVVTAESGRIRPADHLTINKVMGCIKVTNNESKDNKYGVIVNKCNWLKRKRLAEKGVMRLTAVFNQKSSNNTFSTNFVTFLPMVPELDLAENERYHFKNLRVFVSQVPGIESIESVTKIDTRNMAKQLEDQAKKYKMEMEKLEDMIENQQKKFLAEQAEQKRNFDEVIKQQNSKMQEQALAFERQRREDDRKFQKDLQELRDKQAEDERKNRWREAEESKKLILLIIDQQKKQAEEREEQRKRHEKYMGGQRRSRKKWWNPFTWGA